MTPLFVSFFTPDYAEHASGLRKSLDVFGLDHDIRDVETTGDWVRNCAMKPNFIRGCMMDYSDRPIVWLDADARVRQMPSLLFNLDCDFAGHWRQGVELLSGTLYFGPSVGAWVLVQRWCEAQAQRPEEWDQKVLQDVLRRTKCVQAKLPASYCAIFDAPDMCYEKDWVISHHQASRILSGST